MGEGIRHMRHDLLRNDFTRRLAQADLAAYECLDIHSEPRYQSILIPFPRGGSRRQGAGCFRLLLKDLEATRACRRAPCQLGCTTPPTPEGIHWTRAGPASRSWRSLLRGHAEGGRPADRGPRGPGAYHRRRARSTGARRRQDAPRTNERMESGADGRRRRTARSLVRAVQQAWVVTRKRPLGRGLIVTHKLGPRVATSLPTRTRPASRGLGPARSQLGCGRRRAASRPWRNGNSGPPGRPVRGRCDSPTIAQPRAASPVSQHPRSPRPRAPGGPRHQPGATASRTTPVAQSGRGHGSPPAAHPRAAASQPRSTGPRAQADRNPPPAQRRLGAHRSPSRRRQRPAAGGPNPGFPRAGARRSSTRGAGTRTAERLAVEQTARRNFTVRSRTGAAHGTSARSRIPLANGRHGLPSAGRGVNFLRRAAG
jgi:hypothetical protein